MGDKKERPILMSAPMVRALLAGTKTQTRRIFKSIVDVPEALSWHEETSVVTPNGNTLYFAEAGWWAANVPDPYGKSAHVYTGRANCPYGKPGDRLWVRETFALECDADYVDESDYELPQDGRPIQTHTSDESEYHTIPRYRATEPDTLLMIKEAEDPEDQMVWTPSIFMPRWASRITLEITKVRVQRLQEISEEDSLAEGVTPLTGQLAGCFAVPGGGPSAMSGTTAKECYGRLWDSINGIGSWDANPWVWAVSFKVVQP